MGGAGGVGSGRSRESVLPLAHLLCSLRPHASVSMGSLLYAAFFLSGVSGLIYQVTWVRQFGNVFGNTVHSASLVVAVFMLGLGAGSYAGRRAGPIGAVDHEAGAAAARLRRGRGRCSRGSASALSLLLPHLAALVARVVHVHDRRRRVARALDGLATRCARRSPSCLLTPVTAHDGRDAHAPHPASRAVDVARQRLADRAALRRQYGRRRRGRAADRLRARAAGRAAGHAVRGRRRSTSWRPRSRRRRCGAAPAASRCLDSRGPRALDGSRRDAAHRPLRCRPRRSRWPVGLCRDGHGDGVAAPPQHPARRVPRRVLAGARRAAAGRAGRARSPAGGCCAAGAARRNCWPRPRRSSSPPRWRASRATDADALAARGQAIAATLASLGPAAPRARRDLVQPAADAASRSALPAFAAGLSFPLANAARAASARHGRPPRGPAVSRQHRRRGGRVARRRLRAAAVARDADGRGRCSRRWPRPPSCRCWRAGASRAARARRRLPWPSSRSPRGSRCPPTSCCGARCRCRPATAC